jgi:NAD(P)-dependent dehydrogenase (short-subunit alcohol dehydrogenase family)
MQGSGPVAREVKVGKLILNFMPPFRNGSIVFLTSIAGYTTFYDIGLYSSAQTAVLTLTKALAKDLGKQGVRVNSVVTGMLEVKFLSTLTFNLF